MCYTRRDRVTRGRSHRPTVAWAITDRASLKTDDSRREADLTDQAKHMRLNLKGSVRVLNPPHTSPQVTFSKPWGQPACAGGREIQKEALDPKWPDTSQDSEKPCSCDRECSDQGPSPPTHVRRQTCQCIPQLQPLHPKPSECRPQLSTQVPSPRNACSCTCMHRCAGA